MGFPEITDNDITPGITDSHGLRENGRRRAIAGKRKRRLQFANGA
jgi:hypothetical protein